jgi:hypothetical protein
MLALLKVIGQRLIDISAVRYPQHLPCFSFAGLILGEFSLQRLADL